jgi:hypothetical protein
MGLLGSFRQLDSLGQNDGPYRLGRTMIKQAYGAMRTRTGPALLISPDHDREQSRDKVFQQLSSLTTVPSQLAGTLVFIYIVLRCYGRNESSHYYPWEFIQRLCHGVYSSHRLSKLRR